MDGIEVQSCVVLQSCILRSRELFLAVVGVLALRVNAGEVLSDHGCCSLLPLCAPILPSCPSIPGFWIRVLNCWLLDCERGRGLKLLKSDA